MKTQFILAAVLSLATVSAMADSHHTHHKPYRGDRVTVVHHYHQPAPRHVVVQPRRVAPPPVRHVVRHQPPSPRYVEHRPVVVAPPVPVVHIAPPRPVPLRPTANFSLSVNL